MASRTFQTYYQVTDPSAGTISFGAPLGQAGYIVTNGGGTTALTTSDNVTAQPLSGPPKSYTGYTYGNGIIITDGSTYWLYTDDTNLQGTTAASNNSGNLSDISAACYLRGTMILTDRGEVPVEQLATGDMVMTRLGDLQPIRWIGHQRFDGKILGKAGAPVCFRAHSLGENVPHADLYVSPAHAVLVDGHLVAASLLVNDVTIVQNATSDVVEYFHIDMRQHDCIRAHGAWAETYWENQGNRALFHNAREYYELFPDDHGATRATCLPYVNQGDDPLLPALRSMVTPKLTTDQMSENADLHLLVDGKRVQFQQTGPRTWEAFVGTTARSIEIASRTMRPSMDGRHSSQDHRALGVCVYSIELRTSDNAYVIPSDHPALQRGFHGIEQNGDVTWQWTDGRGVIPSVLLEKCHEPVRLVLTASLLAKYAAVSPTVGEGKSTEILAA